MFKVPEKFRVTTGQLRSSKEFNGNNGLFVIPHPDDRSKAVLKCIASNQGGWEHVSVSLTIPRNPTWDEMCYVKGLFWDDTDCVVQYHPPKEDYVNDHKYCLHLWKPVNVDVIRPSVFLV